MQNYLHIWEKSSNFVPDFVYLCKITTNNYKPQTTKIMATIQDINALEERIYDAVQEYLDNPDGYEHATLHVYLDKNEMEYRAEMEDNLQGTEDDGIYPIEDLIRDGEPDNDKASDIANSWIFLD